MLPLCRLAALLLLLLLGTPLFAVETFVVDGRKAVIHPAAQPATVWQHEGAGGALSSASLIPCIEGLMAQAGLDFGQLQAIVFGRGPGSFTGLRSACAVASDEW